jgi:DNA mismatch repair protein MutS
MTYLQDTDNQSFPLISNWLTQSKELAPHLKPILERLSFEHCSGIALSQLESPMMKQFRQSKDEAPDALLFFRMGDFYELFGLDAIIASDICGLTLTSRDKSSPNPVPMAGVPVVGYKNALRKCVLAGFKVAVCEQIEDPKLAKGIVKREIVRIATPAVPGDLADDENQMESQHGCYLASIIEFKKCTTTILREMLESFYEQNFVEIDIPDYKWTPAEVNQILFRNFNNSKKSIEELHNKKIEEF